MLLISRRVLYPCCSDAPIPEYHARDSNNPVERLITAANICATTHDDNSLNPQVITVPLKTPQRDTTDAIATSQAFPSKERLRLSTKTVQGAALALEGVDDVERRDGLALRVLSVRNSVADDALEEGLEDSAGLLVDHCLVTLLDTRSSRRW